MILSFSLAAMIKGIFLVMNRATSWFGSLYFFRKGKIKKKKRYYLVGLSVSLTMFLLLLLGLKIIARYRSHVPQQVYVKIGNPLPTPSGR